MEFEPTHNARVDGHTVTQVYVPPNSSQEDRDVIRKEICHRIEIPPHYLRLIPIERQKKLLTLAIIK